MVNEAYCHIYHLGVDAAFQMNLYDRTLHRPEGAESPHPSRGTAAGQYLITEVAGE